MGGGKGGSKSQTVGYKHYLGMHLVPCHGPVDALLRLTWDERIAWAGYATGGQITVSAEKLFGGKEREGGVSGKVDVMMGESTQTKNSYLLSAIGSAIPAYRGVVSLVFRDFYMGNNPYLKPCRMRMQRVYVRQDGIAQWYQETAAIPVVEAGNVVLSTQNIDLDAIDNAASSASGAVAVGVTIATSPVYFVTVTPNHSGPYVAWSPWGVPSPSNEPGNQGSYWKANVRRADGTSFGFGGPNSSGYANARAAFEALYPGGYSFSGSSQYTFYIQDTPILDNSGGVSMTVSISQSSRLDLNPSHLLRECLTDPDWGMGYAEADVDDDTFEAAADQLLAEGLGISMLWDRQMALESFIAEVVRHIDAALFVSRVTGKFKLKLTRFDYDPDDLIVLDESNIDKIENPSRAAFGELANSVSVKFWNGWTGKDDSITVQDPAGVQMQGAPINTTIQYPGISNGRNAALLAARDLRALSSPYLTCTIYTGDVAADLDIGDTFKLTWGKWNLTEVIMRVTGFAISDGKSSQVRITCVEDVFATPLNAVVVPVPDDGGWVDPSQPPEPSLIDTAIEIPYLDMVQLQGQTSVNEALTSNPDLGFVGAAAVRSSSSSVAARMWTDNGSGYDDVDVLDLCPGGLLLFDLAVTATTFTLDDFQDLDLVTVGLHCQIGDGPQAELVRVDSVDATTGIVTCGRGVLDTTPKPWPAGTPVFFWDNYAGADPTEYATGETVLVKVTPTSGSGEVDLGDAVEHEVELAQRAYRPYPPGNLLIEGQSYPEGISGDAVLTVAWAHRDRLLQTSAVLDDHTAGNIGPEAGTTYRMTTYLDGVEDDVQDDIAGTTADVLPSGEGTVKIEVHSKRDGVYSLQAASHEFFYVQGNVKITEEGDERRTEEDDLKVTED